MTKLLTILFVLLVISSVLAQEEDLYITDKQVIASEDIRNSGITRLSDIFSLINNINYSSINGYEHSVSINGLESYQRELWIIMLNGQRIDFSIFEDGNINNTPVTLDNIDFIEVYTIPQIIEGEFTGAGLIHIHTVIPKDGITLKGKLQIGSETGDPGPYRYTKDNSPNVDNQGTNYSTSLSLRKDAVYSILSFKKNMETLTSPAYIKRIYSITPPLDNWPFLRLYAPSLHVGFKTAMFESEIYATKSETKDYFFFKPYGREIPIKNEYLHIGATGDLYAFKNIKLIYKLMYSKNKLKKVENVLDADPDWEFENIYGNLQSDFFIKNLNFSLGAGINMYRPKKYIIKEK